MHDIIVLSEIGVGSAEAFEQQFTLSTSARFSWFVKPRPYKHPRAPSFSGGVAIGVSQRLAGACTVVTDEIACDGLLWVCIRAAAVDLDRDLYVAAVYAPPGAAAGGIHYQSDIWDTLMGGVLRLRQRGYVMCVGDFNARTGTATEGSFEVSGADVSSDFARVWGVQSEDIDETIVADGLLGLTLPPRMSEDGCRTGPSADALLELCSTTGLAIANGRFGYCSGMFTNVNQSGASVVDYACVDARMWSRVKHFEVLDGTHSVHWTAVSCHHPIVLHISCIDAVPVVQALPPTKADLVYQAWMTLASEAALLDEHNERQRSCEQHWKIRWDRNNVERVEWYREELHADLEQCQTEVAEQMDQGGVAAALQFVHQRVCTVAKDVGLMRETGVLSRVQIHEKRADNETFSMGVVPERLWFDSECHQARQEARAAERKMRRHMKQLRMSPDHSQCPPPPGLPQRPPLAVQQQYLSALRTYRHLRRSKEAAYRAGMRDEVMKCEDVKQFFTLLRQFDTDRRGTTDLAPAVATLADYFAASPVAGASFDEDFHRQVTESLAVLQQGLRDTYSFNSWLYGSRVYRLYQPDALSHGLECRPVGCPGEGAGGRAGTEGG